ncbi:MAG: hypothetical protein IAI49_08530, partial [Candidatus Eremiobacteraeota bacterium]|nr:hypothetical protein [Candidatus Eremiobacteraeota bacterium]
MAMTLALAGCASHVESGSRVEQPLPTPLPSGPVFAGDPPAKMMLERTALGVSPDGVLRYIVRAKFADRSGAPTVLLGGGDVAFDASNARVQWQTRMRFGGAAAIVSFERDVPGIVRVGADVGRPVAPQTITIDPRTWRGAPGLVAPLGPHLVVAGWFPPSARGTVRVLRASARKGAARVVGLVAAPATTFRDTSVRPGAVYRYDVLVPGRARYSQRVTVPAESRGARLGALAGKAMWLSFSPAPLDADAYARLDPRAIVARARASGLRAIELRVAYGAFD